jgi:hypothetical protein
MKGEAGIAIILVTHMQKKLTKSLVAQFRASKTADPRAGRPLFGKLVSSCSTMISQITKRIEETLPGRRLNDPAA